MKNMFASKKAPDALTKQYAQQRMNQMTAMQHQPGMPSTQGGIVGSITNMFAPTQAPGGVMQNIQQRMHLAMQMEYQQGTLFRPRHSPMHPVPATSPDGRMSPEDFKKLHAMVHQNKSTIFQDASANLKSGRDSFLEGLFGMIEADANAEADG